MLNIAKSEIKNVFLENNIEISKIILFGSRVKNQAKVDSDWDFLVITKDNINIDIKDKIISDIQRNLAKNKLFCDIIIRSSKRYNILKYITGDISYYINKEGVVI